MPMRYLLAVDSGGSKCDAVLLTEQGIVLGQGRRDRRNSIIKRHPGGTGRAAGTVAGAVRQALRGVRGELQLHVAGRNPLPAASLRRVDAEIVYHAIREQDAPMALAGAKSGIVALAGTGAFVFGRSEDGREVLFDALGPLYGDHGGAFQIGLAGVRAAGRSAWHSDHATTLAEAIPCACAAMVGQPKDGFDMVGFMLQHHDRSVVASLAAVVDAEAMRGDAVATRIMQDAAEDIAQTVRCVVDRLELGSATLPLIGTGSVAVRSATYWRHLCARVASFAPDLAPVLADRPPVLGHALAMAEQLGIATPEFRANILKTYTDPLP